MDREWVATLRTSLAALRDPARRHERRRRRVRRALVVRALLAVGLAWVTSVVGASPGVELGEVFWAAVTGCAAASMLGAARRVWLVERSARPARPTRRVVAPPLPPVGSVARAPMERLASRERALTDLLTLLGPGAGTVGADAAAAAATLRDHAARMVAVESARQGVSPEAAEGLDAALAMLRQRLEEGVSGYDRMVTAAADAVAATGGPATDVPHNDTLFRLQDAVDTLTGLARGLRAVAGTDGATRV